MSNSSFFPEVLRAPDLVSVITDSGNFKLTVESSGAWSGSDVQLQTLVEPASASSNKLRITLQASVPVRSITLRWKGPFPASTSYLGDAWERAYGDLEWRGLVPERVLPWYFVATSAGQSAGYGVETGPNALCHWTVDDGGVSLVLHVGSGSVGVQLGERELQVATVRSLQQEGFSPFETTRSLCGILCANPRLPQQPVYGGNDWYYAYGQNSRASILRDAATMSELAPTGDNRPFMVIDDGWQGCREPQNGGPWHISSALFGDMASVAAEMKGLGVRPGLWFRPLLTVANVPQSWRFGQRGGKAHIGGMTLDPSVPEALESVAEDMRRFRDWGFELVKHDFSMWDIFGKWGPDYGGNPTGKADWHFADRTRTTAEIIKDFFQTLRDNAGDGVMLIGCNTIGHLGAGLFELQRTGDDTSGYDWERTRKMGVNTLAFRMPQHDTFFAVDADCVGLTNHVPWELNKQWLDVLARSGTPLFVSPDPEALGAPQREALREAFAIAAAPQPIAEPLDWMSTTCPTEWKMGDKKRKYHWSE
jgi:alpha-galactosidase